MDLGRSVAIVPCEVGPEDQLAVCRISPRDLMNQDATCIVGRSGVLEGNQDYTNMCPPEEAQQLMDAMWDAGLRPTRR